MNQENTKTFRCEKSAWNNTFQALGIIESKTVWETVLAWAQKLKSEGAQYKSNTGCGFCQKDKFS